MKLLVCTSVYQVHGSSSGKVGDKALFDEQGKRIVKLYWRRLH